MTPIGVAAVTTWRIKLVQVASIGIHDVDMGVAVQAFSIPIHIEYKLLPIRRPAKPTIDRIESSREGVLVCPIFVDHVDFYRVVDGLLVEERYFGSIRRPDR